MTVAFAGTWHDVVEHRPAFFGAIGGSAVACALLILAAAVARPGVSPESDPSETEIEFHPGFIARLGIDEAIGTDPGTGMVAPALPTEPTPPEPTPPEPTTDGDASTQHAITDDPIVAPRVRRSHRSGSPPTLPSPSTTPGKLPSIGKGDPFASPDGWSDMDQPGEAWATSVMAALAGMTVGAYDGKLEGQYKFQLTICSDGSIDRIINRGGTIAPADRAKVRLALEQLELPRPPAGVRRLMDRRCEQIAHVFVWTARSVK